MFAVIVLLPVFFLPFARVPIETGKGLLIVVGLAVSLIFWLGARFSDGKITIPRSKILISGAAVTLIVLASAIFSPVHHVSFFGVMFDFGTFWFVFSAFLLMLLSTLVLKDSKKAKIVFLGVIASFGLLFLVQLLRMFAPNALSFGILGGKTDNLLGSWNALGLFAGFVGIISLFLIEFFSLSKRFKWTLGAVIVLSLLFIAVVNFPLVWEMMGIFALLIFVYKISFFSAGKQAGERGNAYFPSFSLVVVMVSLLFFMAGQFIGTFLPNKLGLSNVEVGPSFAATMSVAKHTIAKHPILGSGPNRFSEMWAMYKPISINSSIFWNTSFASGSGSIPTFAVTTGVLGILAWLVFLYFFIVGGIKSLWGSIKKGMSIETTLFFFASLYLLVASILYSGGTVLFFLAFAFIGIFIGTSAAAGEESKEHMSASFMDHPKKSFFFILAVVLLMVLTAAAGFKYVERFASVPYFGRAVAATSVSAAESDIVRATSLYQNDLYLRTYSQVYLAKLNSIIAKGSALSDSDKTDLKNSFDQAVNSAQLATTYDSTNYLDFQMLGSVYESAGALGVSGAYDKAVEAYKHASDLNPLNPGLKLAIARSYFSNNDAKDAQDYANQALSLKQDYTDALVSLSQIAKSQGNISSAISYGESALSTDPTNKDLIQYVNTLRSSAPDTSTSTPPAPKTNSGSSKNN